MVCCLPSGQRHAPQSIAVFASLNPKAGEEPQDLWCGTRNCSRCSVATGQADTAYFGFFGLENEAGLAPGMRKAMEGEEPKAKAIEGS